MEKSAVAVGLAFASAVTVSSFAIASPGEKNAPAVDQVGTELNVMFSKNEMLNTPVHLPLQVIANNDFSSGPPSNNPQ
jgi:hypothetical protein